MARLLIVDDDPAVRESLSDGLTEGGHVVEAVGTAFEAIRRASTQEPIDLVLLDLGLPDRNGLEVLCELRKHRVDTPVVVISANTDMSSTVLAMRDGACDYLQKPFRPEELERRIELALRVTLERTPLPRTPTPTPTGMKHGRDAIELVGDSGAMHEVYKMLGLLSASRTTVLIRGESGTGKEIAARVLHGFSLGSRKAPFVPVHCAALPGPLVEAELFGHRRGAFTGADSDHNGKLEAAGEGTLFLDEVGEVPLETQVKLLRVLQERQYERLGETQSRPFKARIVAATHRDLEGLSRAGKFREDLYYRLNVATVTIPPLRERREDIPLIAARLLSEITVEIGSPASAISEAAMDRLRGYPWPGNVRELRNVLTRASVRCRGTVLLEEDIEVGSAKRLPKASDALPLLPVTGRFPTIDESERDLITRVLAHTHGHRAQTCAILGISRPRLLRKIKRYRLEVAGDASDATVTANDEGEDAED